MKNVLIKPSANLLILATVMAVPLNDNISNYREAVLSHVKICSKFQAIICTAFSYRNNTHFKS